MEGKMSANKKSIKLPSKDGVHKLNVVIWEPSDMGKGVKGIVQLSHGMVEYIERYDDFARFLTTQGFVVIGNDHLGHGLTAGCDEDLGYFCKKNKSATVVRDLHTVTRYAKSKYKNAPCFLYGHSMGSFMARRYIMTFGNELAGVILAGTGGQKKSVLMAGELAANALELTRGERYRSPFLAAESFKGYLDRIPDLKTNCDWLTRDLSIIKKYEGDKFTSFTFTINGFKTLFEVLEFVQDKRNFERIPKDLPVFLIAGDADPVGDYSEGVKKVASEYRKVGIREVEMKIYPGARHELINEINRDEVYADVTEWLNGHLSVKNG